MVPIKNKNRNECDLILQLFRFDVRSKSQKKFIDKTSWMKNVMNNPKFFELRDSGQLLGCLTHDSRDVLEKQNRKIPYLDNIAISPTLCNITRDVWIDKKDPNRVLCAMDLLDTDAGKRARQLFKAGSNLSCSMSTKATNDGNMYYIQELLGVDLTYRNDLDSTVIRVNFSESDIRNGLANPNEFTLTQPDPHNNPDNIWFNFSARVLTKEERDMLDMDFVDYSYQETTASPDPDAVPAYNIEDFQYDGYVEDPTIVENSMETFSLRDYLREADLAPHIALQRRINEVINVSKSLKKDKFDAKKTVLSNYIEQFINNYVVASMNMTNTKFNIVLGLRLNAYCKDRQNLNNLQRQLTRYRQAMKKQGFVNKEISTNVNTSHQKVVREVLDYCNSKINKPNTPPNQAKML